MRVTFAFALFAAVGSANCSAENKQTYGEAAVATGVMVAAVGIHRATTSDCWARCSPGYVCNEERGLCEPGECLPACEYGSHCVRFESGHIDCVGNYTPTWPTPLPTHSANIPAANIPSSMTE